MRFPVLIAVTASALLPARPTFAQAPPSAKTLHHQSPERIEDDCPGVPADADRALTRALAGVFEPAPEEIRVIAVEDLGFLGDPRALDVLAHLMLDPSPAVRSAAVRAVRAFSQPRAEQILEDVVRLGRFDEALELQALDALLFQRRPSALAFLERVRDDRDHRFGPKVADAARNLAARWSPPSHH